MLKTTQEKLNIPAWISVKEACQLLNLKEKTVKDKCRNAEFVYKVVQNNRKYNYYIKFTSLPIKFQNRYLNKHNEEINSCYSEAPSWAKAQVEKYIDLIKATESMRHSQILEFLEDWNFCKPEYKTTYSSLMRMRQRYELEGLSGLLSRRGKSKRSTVDDSCFEYFKNLYLVEGAPSLRTCWDLTLGFAIRTKGIDKSEFPSHTSFKRRLEREIPKQSIYLARYGQSAWNRRYGNYIERDYSNVVCGKVWVSDHAQIDVACLSPDGNVVFPWVTAWRDYKSGKWLGWLLQCGNPNSDHIFQLRFTTQSNHWLLNGHNVYIIFSSNHFQQVEIDIKQKNIGEIHYLKSILTTLELTTDDYSRPQPIITKKTQEVLADKVNEMQLNLSNFIILAPEALTCEELTPNFWAMLAKRLQELGYDIFINITNKPEYNYTGCKSMMLNYQEILALAYKAKAIISLRSGLTEILLPTSTPSVSIYTKFRKRRVRNAFSVEKTIGGFSMLKMPYTSKDKIVEINSDKFLNEKALLEEVVNSLQLTLKKEESLV